MGSWGVGSFDNDPASDWVDACCDSQGTSVIVNALFAAVEIGDDYLEVDESCAAIAAAEVVAALKNNPSLQLPDEVKDWVRNQNIAVSQELVTLALRAIGRVRADSELQELEDEAGTKTAWYSVLDDLEQRLRQ